VARVRLTTIAVTLCGALGLAVPSFAAAGSMAGTVTTEGGGSGIQGVEVCLRPEPYSFEAPCVQTDVNGNYKIDGLPAASYHVAFFTYVNDLNFVPESYDDKPLNLAGGDLVPVGATQNVTGINAELEEGGIIEGSAEDAETSGPAVGVEVCATSFFPVEYSACGITGADGSYAINALKTGEYAVSFEGWNNVNYLKRWYDEAEFSSLATKVPVTAGAPPVTGIDAVLQPGSQVLGRVTEAGTGAALKDIEVCVYDPAKVPSVEFASPCDWTDAAGEYAIRSLPVGTYKVVFSQEPNSGFFSSDTFFEQWWKGAGSVNEATPITLAPPQSATGIDAQLVNMIQKPKPDPIQVTFVPRPNFHKPKKCKKGFHKKKVKGGKKRCVRKHKWRGKKAGKGGRKGGKAKASVSR
jgi:hypothetical protein